MQDVKTYNEQNHPATWALKPDGTLRQTGYVVTDTETNIRTWYPNKGQAKSEMKDPGKWGERGERVFPKIKTETAPAGDAGKQQ